MDNAACVPAFIFTIKTMGYNLPSSSPRFKAVKNIKTVKISYIISIIFHHFLFFINKNNNLPVDTKTVGNSYSVSIK
jgi:hypothetical protein